MGKEVIPIERIARAILVIRREKVMLDSDLAALYGLTTENLNKAAKRNAKRFPTDFMFQLDAEEVANLKFHFGISSRGGRRWLPHALTEQGVAILSSVLNSERSGERTRLARWRWRHRHRELFRPPESSILDTLSRSRFSARRRKEHARRACSPA
jgi:ORF6N domain